MKTPIPAHKTTGDRHLWAMDSPWLESYCHNCDGQILKGHTMYLDTDGGLYCSLYCANDRPKSGAGGRIMERFNPGLCVTCALDLGLPSNVFIGGYVCGNCQHHHPLSLIEAIGMVWAGTAPADAGLMECDWCAGYGSSLKEDGDRCSRCDGSGLVPLSWAERTTHSHGTRTAPSELLEDLAP